MWPVTILNVSVLLCIVEGEGVRQPFCSRSIRKKGTRRLRLGTDTLTLKHGAAVHVLASASRWGGWGCSEWGSPLGVPVKRQVKEHDLKNSNSISILKIKFKSNSYFFSISAPPLSFQALMPIWPDTWFLSSSLIIPLQRFCGLFHWTLLLPHTSSTWALSSCSPLLLTANWNFLDKPGLPYLPHFPDGPDSPAKPMCSIWCILPALTWEWLVCYD